VRKKQRQTRERGQEPIHRFEVSGFLTSFCGVGSNGDGDRDDPPTCGGAPEGTVGPSIEGVMGRPEYICERRILDRVGRELRWLRT